MDKKVCGRCKEEKPLDEFRLNKTSKDGHYTICKVCKRKEFHEKYHNDPKFKEQFKQRINDYYDRNSKKVIERVRQYAQENHEKVLEKAKNYWHTKVDKKKYNAIRQARRKERYIKDPEYRKRRIEECQHSRRIRKMRIKNIEGSYTLKEWKELCNKYDNRCACCKQQVKLTADHIVPISKGGTNYITNIQPLCMHCNCSKNDKTIYYAQTN